ncbi:DNA repair protein rad2 [Gryganskiella cystojenkinii]|nr:DNA repair protein rad2 [Gryganskiella cystojenkinii]
MGVKGLWELLHPVARPIKLETLANKQLAIDASIWLHQFLHGMRDKEGQAIGNAHLIGFFRRICKLLYYNIKPIFVYDGGTPALKRKTIQERQRRKHHDVNQVKRTAEKLLAAQLRLHALEQRKAARKKKADEKKAQQQDGDPNNVVHDSIEDPAYLDDLVNAVAATAPKVAASIAGGGAQVGSKAKRVKDNYVLPPMDTDFDTLAKIRSFDERIGFNQQDDDDVNKFLAEFKREGGVANIDSDVFKALPSELQYEILHDIRLRSRVTSYERVQEMVRMSETPMDFSKLQVEGVIRRNIVTHKLLSVNQAVSKVGEETGTTKPGRIASQRNRQYILVKNEEGGWALGGKKPTEGVTADRPVNLDPDEDIQPKVEPKEDENDDDEWESDDDMDFEEVKIPNVESSGPTANIPLVAPMSKLTTKVATPPRVPSTQRVDSIVDHPEAYMDEDESIEGVMAKFAKLEDEQAKSHVKDLGAQMNGDNARTGLGLTTDINSEEHEAARLRLIQAGHSPDWPDILSDDEDIASLDTLNSDQTIDDSMLDDLVEDENTGEIITKKEYDRKYNNEQDQEPSVSSTGRALSALEESRLDQEAFFSYWTGYTAESFKVKHDNYEWMIRDAIFDWDDDQIESEKHSATRKLDKSSVNDVIGIDALEFWITFLTSVQSWKQSYSERPTSIESVPTSSSGPAQADKSLVKPKSRLSQSILLDDDSDEEDELEDTVPISSLGSLESLLPLVKTKQAEEVKLDLSTSIFKRKTASVLSDVTNSTRSSEATSKADEVLVEILTAKRPETLPEPQQEVEMDVDSGVGSVSNDSGVGSLGASPDLGSTPVLGIGSERPWEEPKVDIDRAVGLELPAEDIAVSKGIELEAEPEEISLGERKDEDEDDDEDEAHELDLENEEHNFTQLFPEMATLPGAFVLEPKAPSPPPAPVLTAEEQAVLEQQEATRMFQESRELESEIKVLQDQRRKQQRNADDLTDNMVSDTQLLLKLFGIPYIVAPMEAEAQCADLQIRGVVDGILTEDSDVFLFGGLRVFKNMFKEEKFVECYLMSDIERDLGVGRNRLVELAYLLGSDYATGIKGIGLVTAMEILRLFPKLENFAKWWRGEQLKKDSLEGDSAAKNLEDGDGDWDIDHVDEIALDKLAKSCKKIEMPTTFPDPHIADAYIHPMVDDDPTKFQWGIPDLDGLRDHLRVTLGWDRAEVDRLLLPIIRQMSRAHLEGTQSTLDGFFDASVGTGAFHAPIRKNLHKSARLRKVVSGLTGGDKDLKAAGAALASLDASSSPADSDSGMAIDKESSKKAKKTPAKRKQATTAGAAKKPRKKKQSHQEDESVEGSEATLALEGEMDGSTIVISDTENGSEAEEGSVEPASKKKRTVAARPRASHSSSTRAAQLRVPEAVTAAKNNLKSKNIEVILAARKKLREEEAAAAAETAKSTTTSSPTASRRRPRSNGSGTSSSGGSDNEDVDDDFAPSHWDLLARKEQRYQGSQARTGIVASQKSPAASPTKLNANRYTTSFRTKDAKSTTNSAIIPRSPSRGGKAGAKRRGDTPLTSTPSSPLVETSPPSSPSTGRGPAKKSKLSQ